MCSLPPGGRRERPRFELAIDSYSTAACQHGSGGTNQCCLVFLMIACTGQVRLAVVGGGTGAAIPVSDELCIGFTPSKVTALQYSLSLSYQCMRPCHQQCAVLSATLLQANAEHLSAELPFDGEGRVLYPASAKAGCSLQVGLLRCLFI